MRSSRYCVVSSRTVMLNSDDSFFSLVKHGRDDMTNTTGPSNVEQKQDKGNKIEQHDISWMVSSGARRGERGRKIRTRSVSGHPHAVGMKTVGGYD